MNKYYAGTGRRKTAIVQARISEGKGIVKSTNGKEIIDEKFLEKALMPIREVADPNKYDLTFKMSGGGISSRREASLLAVAKAISKIDEGFEKTLKKQGFLTRDSREKERKKPGLKRARRAPQWAKR